MNGVSRMLLFAKLLDDQFVQLDDTQGLEAEANVLDPRQKPVKHPTIVCNRLKRQVAFLYRFHELGKVISVRVLALGSRLEPLQESQPPNDMAPEIDPE